MSISNIVLPFVANPAQMSPFYLLGRDFEPRPATPVPCEKAIRFVLLHHFVRVQPGALDPLSLCTLHW